MTVPGRARPWAASLAIPLALLAAFVLLQYGDALRVPFINDDYIFLDKTRNATFLSLWEPRALAFHWYRPWSRELHYWAMQQLFGARELPFHVASLLIALGVLVGFFALARRLAGTRAAAVAAAGWAALAAWAVPMLWVAGVQDLWMLVFALGSLGFAIAGRTWASAGMFALALLSKESAAVLPAILVALGVFLQRRSFGDAVRRVWPHLMLAAVWALFHPLLGGRLWRPIEDAATALRPPWATVALRTLGMPLNLDGLPAPEAGWLGPLVRGGLGALLLGLVVLWGQRAARRRATVEPTGGVVAFGLTWALLGWVPLLLPGLGWHSYYALFGAAGAWLAIGAWLARRPAAAAAVVAALALLRAGHATTPSRDWGTESYQRRAAEFLGSMRADLLRRVPAPPPNARMYFVRVPSHVGFLAGDGPALRVWYADPTLRGGYYPSYRPRRRQDPAGPDYFFRFDSTGHWVQVVPGREDVAAALAENPRWFVDHEVLAQNFARAGDWRSAAAEYIKLASVDTLNVPFAYNAGIACEALGDSARAARWFARAATLPGADAEAREAAGQYRHLLPRR